MAEVLVIDAIRRWLRRRNEQDWDTIESQAATRADLERRVDAQLRDLIAYLDRLSESRDGNAAPRRKE